MSEFINILREDGLARVHRALDGLEADSSGLDRVRTRFSQSSSSYTLNSSGTLTRSASSDPFINEQRRREQRKQRFYRRKKLMKECEASLSLKQFKAQRDEEKRRI